MNYALRIKLGLAVKWSKSKYTKPTIPLPSH